MQETQHTQQTATGHGQLAVKTALEIRFSAAL